MSNQGKKVKTHYRGTLDDGTQFDSSYDRGEPLEFTCGAGQMIKGFDAAVVDMQVGEKKTVHIPAADAYGEHNPEMVITFPAEQVPNIEQIEKGMKLFLSTPSGMPVPAVVIDVTPEAVTLDATTSWPARTSTLISSSSRSRARVCLNAWFRRHAWEISTIRPMNSYFAGSWAVSLKLTSSCSIGTRLMRARLWA